MSDLRCRLLPCLLLAFVFNPFQLEASSSSVHRLQRRQAPGSTNDTTAQDIDDIVGFLGPRNEVDFVAVLQRNQGMGKRNFYTQIRPSMEALMVRYATLHRRYVRSAVVTFSSNVYVPYDHISNGSDALTKCELFGGENPLWNQVVYDNDYPNGASIGQALNVTIAILNRGRRNRPNVTQVVMVMTDGDFTISDDPISYIPQLKDLRVQVFAAGLGAWLKPLSVSSLASKLSYYGQLDTDWQPLLNTIRSSVGSDVSPLLSRLPDSDVCAFSGSNCTDVSSGCYCDVDRAVAECRCNAGYSRLPSSSPIQCQACPPDTYRSEFDDDDTCLPCSPGYGTEQSPNGTIDATSGCQCQSGNNCTDPCAAENSPCSDHEICSFNTITDSPACSCRLGWTSPTCSVNPNDCPSQQQQKPCLNGGVCYDRLDDVQCICPFGFRGEKCEIDEDYCVFDICVKNNTKSCASPGNNYICICNYGWIGDFCENHDPNPTQPTTVSTSTPSPTPSSFSSSTPAVTSTPTPELNNSSSPISEGVNVKDGDSFPVNIIIIIVCVVGGVLLILLLVLVVVIATSRRRNRRREEEKREAEGEGMGRTESFQTPRRFGVRSTGTGPSRTISGRFSGLWKKWTVRAHDPAEWYNAGVPSVPNRRPGLDEISDSRLVDRDEATLRNEVIVVDDRLNGWNSYLQELERSGIVDGAIIAETDAHECAKTKGWRVDWTELDDLEKVIDSRKVHTKVKVQGQTYQIQSNDGTMATGFSEAGMGGYDNATYSSSTKSLSSSSSSGGKTVTIGVTKTYLIVAVANANSSEESRKEIQWVVDHITAEGY